MMIRVALRPTIPALLLISWLGLGRVSLPVESEIVGNARAGTQGAIGCGANPKRVNRLVIDKPGIYENYLVDGEW
jgi:hypothetical protein